MYKHVLYTIYTHFEVQIFAINTFTRFSVLYITCKRTMDSQRTKFQIKLCIAPFI